jgi:ribosome biogenesis protein NSA1
MFESSDGESKLVTVMECGNAGIFDLSTPSSPRVVFEWKCPPNVACSAYHEPSGLLAVGCQGAELKAYNIGTEEPSISAVYAAKGGKPNNVGLCDRPWNSAVTFDPSAVEGNRIIVGTGYYKLRLYDSKVGKRPQLDVKFKDYKISKIVPERNGRRWWVGDGGGNLQVYDVRAGKFDGAIKGIGGAVRDIDIRDNYIASVGLDRFVRVNSTSSRASLAKVYIKSQLTGVCLLMSKPVEDEHVTNVSMRKRPADSHRLQDGNQDKEGQINKVQKKKV